MTTKLTLSLDEKIISKAKRIAARKKTSISKLVSSYFEKLPDDETRKDPSVLIGILKPKNKSVSVEDAVNNARWEHLKKKHGL
ncbi:MAG TPA: DUF6364 family protein [Parafilimonas sp.]|nr:DUF6364 family protein [Parafilimonas sp.]